MLTVPLPKQHQDMDQVEKAILSHTYEPIEKGEVVSVLVMKAAPSQREEEEAHFELLENSFVETPNHQKTLMSHLVVFQDFKIKMTQFDELTVYEIIAPRSEEAGKVVPPVSQLPSHWVTEIPGVLVSAFYIDILFCEGAPQEISAEEYCSYLLAKRQFGGIYGKNKLIMVTSLTRDETGTIPFVVVSNDQVSVNELGRFINRLVMLNAFYMAALTFLVEKNELLTRVDYFDAQLRSVSLELEDKLEKYSDEQLYKRLTELSVQIESLDTGSHRTLHATREYISLVKSLLGLIREERLSEVESYQNFVMTTLEPIERSNQLLTSLINSLNKKVFQQNDLVRSRIDIRLEQQNQEIFNELKYQAKKQIQLQETVEGFSVAAISYYSVSLIGYGLKSLPHDLLMGISVDVWKGIAVPVVVMATYWSMQKIKRKFGLETFARVRREQKMR